MTRTGAAVPRPRRRPTSPGPLVAYGDGAIHAIPPLVRERGWGRVMLVCGERSFTESGADAILPALQQVAAVERWSGFRPNTDAEDLVEGIAILRSVQPDAVIGVGGGSAMDMAKLLCAFDGEWDPAGLRTALRSGAEIVARDRGLVLAPTTSGTGSETTRFAVVYLGEDKCSVAGPAMLPDVAVLDPQLSVSGSPYQRATSGIDAVSQAIESLWAVGATEGSRRAARHALRLLLPSIEPFVTAADPHAARAMSIGAHLAGRAIDVSRTTAAHALSYGITKRYGVSHGHAVALTLGPFIEAHATAPRASLRPTIDAAQFDAAMEEVLRRLGAADGGQGRERFVHLLEGIGLPARLADVGVEDAAARRSLAAGVNAERLGNNPVVFDRDGLVAILDRAG